ncbi:universal stress protein [Marinicella sediminis]|uniref:Universal stress protein n=1 Tax=Marinicella sediminis TaxID=1792834 RepID=A0ABV7J8H5_9GAMM|nr:universal stress protein [Marinicella sediminis]
MKVICVPVVNRPECAVALETAFKLAKPLSAAIMGYHLRAHSDSEISLPEAVSSLVNGEQDDVHEPTGDQQSASDLFAQVAESFGYAFSKKAAPAPVAWWQARTGSPDKLFSIVGPVTDMIVVSRPGQSGGKTARQFMLSALLNSGKPTLVLPQQPQSSVGKKICIAWNQSPEAARAVTAAMPMLQQAEQVTIITNGQQDRVGPKARHLQHYLTLNGVDSTHLACRESQDIQALLSAYEQSQSDLMVMGAYSRSRLRQVIFGGVTEHMLFKADVPVLMMHS